MNLIELAGKIISEKVSKKQIVSVATILVLWQIEAPPLVKAVCITVVGITAIIMQWNLDKGEKNENKDNSGDSAVPADGGV